MFSEQRSLRYLAKVRVLKAVRAAVTSISGKSSSTRGCACSGYAVTSLSGKSSSTRGRGGGGVQALYSLFGVGEVPRPHHSPEYRDNPRPGFEYRDNPIPSPFPLINQGGAGQTHRKNQSPPGHGR
jgi:hypothetical protein